MTYGENAGAIRAELTALLGHHRIQQRLGGKGTYVLPETTTREERADLGRAVQRYRYALLLWCAQALDATGDKQDVPCETSHQTPIQRLRRLVALNLDGGAGPLRLTELLTVPHGFDLVTRWQRAARAAALGEHDFAAGIDRGQLSPPQVATVVKDAVQVIRALGVLDLRYDLVPGWASMVRRDELGRIAGEVHSTLEGYDTDTSVDLAGRRPHAVGTSRLDVGGLTGLSLAVSSQHNVVVELSHLPTALNLRRVLSLQALVSREAARCAHYALPSLIPAFEERADVYRQLVADCRNLAGLVGSGGDAVVAAHRVLGALRSIDCRAGTQAAEPLRELRRLFRATDARTAVLLERGLAERCYFVGVTVPRLGIDRAGGVVHPRLRYMPVDSQPANPILPVVRDRLRPVGPRALESSAAVGDRTSLSRALAVPASDARPTARRR